MSDHTAAPGAVSKRDALLHAAKTLLWERGFAATSPRQILRRSGAGQGSLYHHFSGKKALAVCALDQIETEMSAIFDQLFEPRPHLSLVERVASAFGQRRDALKGCPLGRIAADPEVFADAELREPAARHFRHVQRSLADALRRAADSGEIRLREPPTAIAAALVASVQGGYVLSRVHNDPRYLQTAVQCTLSMFRLFVNPQRPTFRPRHALPVVSLGV